MFLQDSKLPAIDVPGIVGSTDWFTLCDTAGFIQAASEVPKGKRHENSLSFLGGQTFDASLDCVRNGDLSGVAASDKFMESLESETFISQRFRIVDSVVGCMPNVPAFIAGSPVSMRRRIRSSAPSAPLSVFADLTSSATIGAQMLRKRGAAILALVRVLTNLRPVELWAFTGLGRKGMAKYVAIRIDTTPLDLARAAHILTAPSIARGLCYGISHARHGYESRWPYDNINAIRKHASEIMRRVIMPGSDVLAIPAVFGLDESISNPLKWLKDKLAEYGGETVATE